MHIGADGHATTGSCLAVASLRLFVFLCAGVLEVLPVGERALVTVNVNGGFVNSGMHQLLGLSSL